MLALIGEGNHSPSADQVSERAGVGLRSVFRHFNDMESLHQSISNILSARLETAARLPFLASDWKGQLLELIERRAKVYEAAGAFLLAGQVHRYDSKVLRANHRKFVGILRQLLLDRLATAPGLEQSAIEAIDLLLSFEAWQRLRSDQRLSVAQAKDVLRQTMTALLKLRS